ncbi:MAG TPA: TonB-dependent receptor, partial [Caulobacteraceae bacterium]|nr:TonB-dependent receptor [Caulobacteraceae bacterium]
MSRLVLPAAVAAASLIASGAAAQDAAKTSNSTEVQEVVVSASPVVGDPDRFATIVETVRRDDVVKSGGANIADVLRDTPGVAGTGFAAGASRPVIRGMDAERVKMVENGLSSSDVSDVGPDHGVPIDPLSAQAIEVVRGAATLRYGSQAIGGVVNTFNNRVPRNRIEGFKGEALGAYESVSQTGEGAASLDAGKEAYAFHFDGFGRRASDYDTPLGNEPNSYFIGSGYSAGGSYFFDGDSRVGAAGEHYQSRYGIPGEDTFISMRQNKGEFGSELRLKDRALQTVTGDASYADYTHSEIDPATGEALATFNNTEWDCRLEATYGAFGPLSGAAIGLQGQDRKFSGLGEAADYLLPTHTQSLAGFVFTEATMGRLQWQGAVRLEDLNIDGTPASGVPASRKFTPASFSVGFTWPLSEGLRLGLNFASAARAPAQTELFARGPHDGPGTFETGDPDLGLERANSVEASVRFHSAKWGRLEASLWNAHFDDYIYGALTGRLCDQAGFCAVSGTGAFKQLNYAQQGADFWGAELKGDMPLKNSSAGQLSLTVLGDYVRAKFADGGGDVPRIQPGRIGGGLAWTSEFLDASFQVLAVAAQRQVGLADLPTDGYTSVEAEVGFRPLGEGPRKPEIVVVGHNLADEVIRNATALNKDTVIMPGRDVRVAV